MKKKLVVIIPVVVLLLIAAVVAGVFLTKGYRVIQVYDTEGRSVISRENKEPMDAYVNLNLLSGDQVRVLKESLLRLRMDQDKYMLAEPNTDFQIFATGKEKNSKTDIRVNSGSMTLEVQKKLGNKESFEVMTPNAVMAVRGTVFRVSISYDKNNKPVTMVSLFEGEIEIFEMNEEGERLDHQILTPGKKAIIRYRDDPSDPMEIIIGDISLDELPMCVLEYLLQIENSGRQLCFTAEEIQQEIDRRILVEPEKPVDTTEPTETVVQHTVTFLYQGKVFGRQTVPHGEKACVPKLVPSSSGKWDFDFNKPVLEDISIEFME